MTSLDFWLFLTYLPTYLPTSHFEIDTYLRTSFSDQPTYPNNFFASCMSYYLYWFLVQSLKNWTFCIHCKLTELLRLQNFGEHSENFWFCRDFFLLFVISSENKIGRPILVNLPPYHVPFSSHHDLPTYLPKKGTSLMDVPLSTFHFSMSQNRIQKLSVKKNRVPELSK